jgi:putative SOS response-associated peptidase YedK
VVIEEGGRRLLRLALPLPSGRQSGRKLLSCAAITDEPPAELAAAGHERCIVNLARAAVDRWLAPLGRPAAELQALLDERERPYYEHEVPAA